MTGANRDAHDADVLQSISDYLDRGRLPYDAAIEEDLELSHVLARLARIRSLTHGVVDRDAQRLTSTDQASASGGAMFPEPPLPSADKADALRAVIRKVGDAVTGVLVKSTEFVGDLSTWGAPVRVRVTILASPATTLVDTADRLREKLSSMLRRDKSLNLEAVDVVVADVLPTQVR